MKKLNTKKIKRIMTMRKNCLIKLGRLTIDRINLNKKITNVRNEMKGLDNIIINSDDI